MTAAHTLPAPDCGPTTHRLLRAVPVLAVALLASLTLVGVHAGPAAAAGARVTFTPGTADGQYATKFSLQGSGFQAIKGGFGGVYILFGTVSGTWQPSKGGVSGVNYVYVQDSETKDNHGYQKFVSFQDGGTLYAANGGIVNPDGTWATDLIVPGPSFPAKGRDGGIERIDCLKVQCGFITIGAHGVVDPQNETFTPVTFAGQTPPAASSTAPATGAGSPSTATTNNAGGLVVAATASPGGAQASDPTAESAAATSHSSSTTGWLIVAIAALIVLLGFVGSFALRRRRPTGERSTT